MSTLLTIVPNPDFSASLQFALEAEGYAVICRTGFADHRGMPAAFDCCILDHHAAREHMPAVMALVDGPYPVVLLANSETHPLAARSFRTVTKPCLGALLSKAIAEALDRKPTA